MFDFSDFNLQTSIGRHNQKVLAEQEQAQIKQRKLVTESIIDNLVNDYKNMNETASVKLIDRKSIAENAAISAVKDVMYGIFENALLITETEKAENHETIKSLFESYFYNTLKENDVDSFRKFNKFIESSDSVLSEVSKRARDFATINESIYHEFLESAYADTYMDKLIVETFDFLSESDNDDEKAEKVETLGSQMLKKAQTADFKLLVAMGPSITRFIVMAEKISRSSGRFTVKIIDKLVGIINRFFGGSGDAGILNKLDSITVERREQYLENAKEIRKSLFNISNSIEDKSSKEYKKIVEKIGSADKVIDILEKRKNEFKNSLEKRSLKEATGIEFITEAESSIANMTGENKELPFIEDLKYRISEQIKDIDPIKGLEELHVVNQLYKQPECHDTIITKGQNGANVVLLIIRGLKIKNIPESLQTKYLNEGDKYKKNLDVIVDHARKTGKLKEAELISKQSRRLGAFLNQYKLNNGKMSKLVKESASPLLFNAEEAFNESMNAYVGNILEAAQYVSLYETSPSDMDYIVNLVQEACKDDMKDVSMENNIDSRDILLSSVRENANVNLDSQAFKLESIVYQNKYMVRPEGLHEAAGNSLKSGKYPNSDDFFDPEEKEIFNKISSSYGSAKISDVVKNKVFGVIESEQKRIKDLEEEQDKIISKLTRHPDMQESVKTNFNDSKTPKNLFESIVMNRSKKYIKEATELGTGFDIIAKKNTIMSEAVAIYTIHETFNTLNFGTYDQSRVNKLSVDYYNNKI